MKDDAVFWFCMGLVAVYIQFILFFIFTRETMNILIRVKGLL